MVISNMIVTLLKQKGLKQVDLCKKVGIPKSTLNNWLKLGRSIPSEYIIPICEFFDVPVEYLLTGEEINNNSTEYQLSDDEIELLKNYRKLDSRGKTMVKAKVYEEIDRMNKNLIKN